MQGHSHVTRHKQHAHSNQLQTSGAASTAALHPASESSLKPWSSAVIVNSEDCSIASGYKLAHVNALLHPAFRSALNDSSLTQT